MARSFAFVFACTPGDFEIKSALLAASLARSLRCDRELIALIPQRTQSSHKPSTLAFLRRLGVRMAFAPPPDELNQSIGSSIECLRVPTDCEKLVLLDSGQLLLNVFTDEPRFSIPFNACSAFEAPNIGDEAAWRLVFKSCDTHMPMTRAYSSYSGQYFPLCFDPGFVAVHTNIGFGDVWLECCHRIVKANALRTTQCPRQTSLAVAAAKLGLDIDILEERYNHPIWLKPLDERDSTFFARYDNPTNILREPALLILLDTLSKENADLKSILNDDPVWQPIAKIAERAVQNIRAGDPLAPELIITGIPRSGTSYLCSLLHKMNNCVILNEPDETPSVLNDAKSVFGLARFLRERRHDVIAGTPISNKLNEGQITQDTAKSNQRQPYHPTVASANFVLGMKETLAFVSRLGMLRQMLPSARVVACVRNPLDTIASWKGSFPHLNIADVVRQPIGNPVDPWLTKRQHQELRTIAAIIDPASRRAAWWRYLANLILEARDHLIIVRYADLVTHPRQVLGKILEGWPAGVEIEPIEPSTVRQRRQLLCADDILAIRALCKEPARALGISIDP